jgi:hypothetical protein
VKINIDMIQGKRVLHVVMEDDEILAFDHLLNRGLNTMKPEAAKPWIELEYRIDQFIRSTVND